MRITPISPLDKKAYHEDGFVHLKQIIPPEALVSFSSYLRAQMDQLNPNRKAIGLRDTYKRAFTQVTNLWQHSPEVQAFVFDKNLAQIAADVMGVSGVRLYHDQALFKEAGGGPTPWHVDQVYWPMDTVHTCTFWIPLQNTPRLMGSLSFAKGSQHTKEGRSLLISDESERIYAKVVESESFEISNDDFTFGDISIHGGWTIHRAGPNMTEHPREVMTIIYMADDSQLLDQLTPTQLVDRDAFTPDIQQGQLIDSELNPILYTEKS